MVVMFLYGGNVWAEDFHEEYDKIPEIENNFVEDGVLDTESFLYAVNKDIQERYDIDSYYYQLRNEDGYPLNEELARRGLMVYGNHTDIRHNDYRYIDSSVGSQTYYRLECPAGGTRAPRYLGYDMEGNKHTTLGLFPPDAVSDRTFPNDFTWIKKPWQRSGENKVTSRGEVRDIKALYNDWYYNYHLVKDYEETEFTGKEELSDFLRTGIAKNDRSNLREYYNFCSDSMEEVPWHKVTAINNPPTSLTYGTGKLYHWNVGVPGTPPGIPGLNQYGNLVNSDRWYMSVGMAPEIDFEREIDFKAIDISTTEETNFKEELDMGTDFEKGEYDPPSPRSRSDSDPSGTSTTKYEYDGMYYTTSFENLCSNYDPEKPYNGVLEILPGDWVRGEYQFAAYEVDVYDRYTRSRIYTYEDDNGETVRVWTGEYTSWSRAGTTKVYNDVTVDYEITPNHPDVQMEGNSGNMDNGQEEFHWMLPETAETTAIDFDINIDYPDGTSDVISSPGHKSTSTVLAPREIQIEPIWIEADNVYYGPNKQIAFTRITNLRDIDNEVVDLTYIVDGEAVKTEELILPSGKPYENNSILRAFEFIPQGDFVNLEVRAEASKKLRRDFYREEKMQGEVEFKFKETTHIFFEQKAVCKLYQDDELILREIVEFIPGETKTMDFNWQGEKGQTEEEFKAEIWPVDDDGQIDKDIESTPEDNVITKHVDVEDTPIGDIPKQYAEPLFANESQTYEVKDRYHMGDVPNLSDREQHVNLDTEYHHTTDIYLSSFPNGALNNLEYDTYEWEATTRPYEEAVRTLINIDSWQGDSERGRGAWEIGPLFGDAAHRTVRAGTGFELDVEVNYTTNFGENPPVDHAGRSMDLGVEPEGARRVFAAFPYANYVNSPPNEYEYTLGNIGYHHGEQTEMELYHGERSEWVNNWHYPEHTYEGETDEYSARTHVIDKFFPNMYPEKMADSLESYMLESRGHIEPTFKQDDRYRFNVVSEVSGVSNIVGIQEDHVFIFGHIFDDIWYDRPFRVD